MQHPQRHAVIDRGLKLDQQIEKDPLGDPLPMHLERPDDVLEALLEQRRDVVAAVVLPLWFLGVAKSIIAVISGGANPSSSCWTNSGWLNSSL